MNDPVLLTERWNEASTVLCLNRPERRNALTIELLAGLCEALDALAADRRQRVVILCGAGPAFCAGLDLHEVSDLEAVARSAEILAQTLQKLAHTHLITIASVQGAAYAGGAGLMAACDLVLAADDARIGFPEVRRGLVPAVIAAVLRDRMRDSDLRELLLLAEPMNACRAQNAGLINQLVPAADLLTEAKRWASTLLRGAPEAVRQTKRLLREIGALDASRVFSYALEFHRQQFAIEEAAEGLAAWRERRSPHWPAR